MRAIAVEQGQYKTYILSDSINSTRLEVVPERGGIITRWRWRDRDLLYLDAERFANRELSVRGGIPILFPICGNLPDNTYTYQGQSYLLKQHGFARDLPWQVTAQSEPDPLSLTLTLTSNNQTYAAYPFDFCLEFTYQLQGDTLNIQQRYLNQSAEPMPLSTGLHPYFQVADKNRLQLDIPAEQYQDQMTKQTHAYSGGLDFNQTEIDIAFSSPTRQQAAVSDPEAGVQISLSWDSAYTTLVFWTVQGKDYYCLEPWTAPRNALNTGEHLISLAPGATLETCVTMTAKII
ncbi:aldose epimerase [Desertifilum sp. FACHB-1129]|uniref:Aldose epimerase n=1 Tax=Desertifilum tharense IPPAS B-1220 TaxID=1781255 RepID=A0A1E5QJ45_9CYAN|nr:MULTISPECIES: aldose epimerase [Desertifilum]MDA0213139.1 aldose epimerase [Cyanobacteria bacterium FC1]MBD2314521.1 aldose epimerase [Desertifilum sp. FACHB-1129]MBD2321078.1 aldose epimerase [Desertifilum sp. FACHB-866]MBD2331613.1 aldose epimerase [Desertifilum sp. FACHB-868]OEJ74709.1 aldose epimerase [Desertifilum tharense IPPAS B-1220]